MLDRTIKQTFTYTTVYAYMFACTIVLPYPKVPIKISRDEISLNPIVSRDRQSTLRFEKSISAPSEKINLDTKQKLLVSF